MTLQNQADRSWGATTGIRLSGLALAVCALVLEADVMAAQGFEAPPVPFETVARPADGETVSANPPCFVYPAVKRHDAYVVEYSRSAGFPEKDTTILAGEWMLNVPEQPLTPGRWHWRWRPGRSGDDGQVVWSDTRSFTMPSDIPTVPFPRIDALVAKMGCTHPRVLVSSAELADIRARAREQHGPTWLGAVKQYATRVQTGDLLAEPDFLPDRKDPRRLGLYQQTFRTYRPFFREMSRLAENYLLTGDDLSGREAKRRLLHIVSWDPAGSTELLHNDELGTEVVRHCPKVYDWIHPLLTTAERERCLECFRIRMEAMFRLLVERPFEKRPYASHVMGYYLPDLLQACLAVSGDLPVDIMLRYTLIQLWSPFFPPYGDADGGWNEGPGYWGWMAAVCARMYVLVERATGIPVRLRSNLRNQAYYKLYANPYWFKMSPFGDGQESPARHGSVMLKLASLYGNPYAEWCADAQGARLSGLDGLLFPTENVVAKPPLDLPQGRCFRDVGLACSHTSLADGTTDVAFLLRSCPFGGISHSYADQNTFALDAFGEPLIIASGYYQLYGHPHHAQWTRQTVASNSLLVNGKGQPWSWDAKGRVAEFATSAAADYIVGDASQAYPGVLTRYDRRVLFLRPLHSGGEALIVIHDAVDAGEPSSFQFLLHAQEKMAVDEAEQRVTIRHGNAACQVDFLAPQRLSFEQDDRFPKPPVRAAPNQWHLRASTEGTSLSASSALAIQPYRLASPPGLLEAEVHTGSDATAVVLSDDTRHVVALFRTAPAAEAAQLCGLRTDAQAASVTLRSGQVCSIVLFDGSFLEWHGRLLLRSASIGTVSCTQTLAGHLLETITETPTRVELAMCSQSVRALSESGECLQVTGEAPVAVITTRPHQLIILEQERLAEKGSILPRLAAPGCPPAPFTELRYPRVQRTVWSAPFMGVPGIYRVTYELAGGDGRPGEVLLRAGTASRRVTVPAGATSRCELTACSLERASSIELLSDAQLAGTVRLIAATAERCYGVNLLPNASFDDIADGVPVGVRAATIAKNARCEAHAVPGGRHDDDCLRITCTEATGGDFGAMLEWPAIRSVDHPRRFRMSCWVRTDATSVAGLQVTSRDWRFWKNTPRLKGATGWTESATEFVLPAGVDLTNARLHMHASKTGAQLFVDDVSIVELPPEELLGE